VHAVVDNVSRGEQPDVMRQVQYRRRVGVTQFDWEQPNSSSSKPLASTMQASTWPTGS
jgi:hypothetical protein